MPLFVIKGRPIEFGLASLLNNKTVYRRVCDEIRRNGGKITHSLRRCFDNQVVQLDDREVHSVVSVGNEMITSSAHQARGPDSFHYSYVERCVMSGYVLDPRPFRVQRDSVFTCDASILRVVLADWTWKRLLAQKQLSSTTDVSNRKQLPDQIVPKHSVEATVTSIAEYNKHDAARQRPPAVTTVNCSSQSNLSGNGSFSVASQHGRRQKRFSELQLEFLSGSRAVTSSSLRRPVPSKREGLLRSRVKKRPGSLNLVRSSALDRNSDRTEFCHSGDLQTSTRTGSTVTAQCLDRSTQSALRVCSSSLECGRSGGFAAVSYHGSYNHDKNVLPASGNDNNIMLPVNGHHDKMVLPTNGVHDKISVVNGNHDSKKVNADRSIIRPFDSCLSTNSSTISSDSFKNGISRLDDFSSCGETASGSVDIGTIDDQDDILESSLLNSPRLGCSQRPHSSALNGMKHQHTSAISSQAHAQSNLTNVYAKDTCVDSVASTSNSSISAPVIENSLISCDSHVAVNRSHSNCFSSDICESIAPVSPIPCELPQLPSAALTESHSAIPMTRTGRQSIPESSPKLTDQHIIILINSIVCCHEEGCLSPAAPITNPRFWYSLHPLLPNTLQQYSAEFLHVHFVDEVLPRLGSWQQYLDHCVVQRFIKLLPVPIADAARSQLSSKQEISAPENRSVTGASVLLERVLSRFVAPPRFLN